jgi:hypothetical protein
MRRKRLAAAAFVAASLTTAALPAVASTSTPSVFYHASGNLYYHASSGLYYHTAQLADGSGAGIFYHA